MTDFKEVQSLAPNFCFNIKLSNLQIENIIFILEHYAKHRIPQKQKKNYWSSHSAKKTNINSEINLLKHDKIVGPSGN